MFALNIHSEMGLRETRSNHGKYQGNWGNFTAFPQEWYW